MTQALSEAIVLYAKNDGVVHVDSPEPGQRVTVLTRNDWGHFIPCIATVKRVFKAKVLVSLYTDKSVPYYASRENIWTFLRPEPHCWHATRDGELCAWATLSGTHQCWIGEIHVQSGVYERRYPEIDYNDGELVRAQIVRDWMSEATSFTRRDPPCSS